MNAIRPSDPKVPVLPQYYVYSADNNHVGPVSAEVIARGIVAPLGSNAWTPYAQVPEVERAVTNAKKQSTPPPPPASAEFRAAPIAAAQALFNPPPSMLPPTIPPAPPLPSPASLAPPVLEAAPAPAAPVEAKKEEKKEEKKGLDPKLKLLPLGIFAAFAFLSILETVIVLVARR